MNPEDMLAIYRRHREAEDARNFDGVFDTLTADCFLDQVSIGLRSEGRDDADRAYREWFGAFPDLGPIPEGIAFGDDVLVAYGQLHGTMVGDWLGLSATGRAFTVPLVNIVPFKGGRMHGERILYDAASFCDQVGIDLDDLRLAAQQASTHRG